MMGPFAALSRRTPRRVKEWIRASMAKAGLEIGTYTGSFAQHRSALIRTSGVRTVWDVGANDGQYGLELRRQGYTGRIVSLEPNEISFRKLSRRANENDKWTAIATAVGEAAGSAILNIAANTQSSSLLPMTARHASADPASRYVDTQRVRMSSLDELLATLDVPNPHFVKLDIQGAELSALRGGQRLLGEAEGCEVELSFAELYEGGAKWQDVIGHLDGLGMSLCDLERVFYDAASGDLLQVNALFRKRA